MVPVLCGRVSKQHTRYKNVTRRLRAWQKRSTTDLQKHGLPPFAQRQKHDPRHTGPAPPSPSHPQASITPHQALTKMASQTQAPNARQTATPRHGGAHNARVDNVMMATSFPNIARWTVSDEVAAG